MDYTIVIGNAVPEFSKDDGRLMARWVVRPVYHESAPTFPNDELTGISNSRSVSCVDWVGFCNAAGLTRVFLDNERGLLSPHPGCQMLTPQYHAEVVAALERQREIGDKPPGFESPHPSQGPLGPDNRYDSILATLLWLEWWMRRALETCETPAVYNY